jgi:hypothetical protein
MNNHHDTILAMGAMTAGGWAISMADVEVVVRLISLAVPAVLSVIVFMRDQKKRKNEKKN